MSCIHEKLIMAVLLVVLPRVLFSQTPKPNFILNEPDTLPRRVYVARNYISFRPGYVFTPSDNSDSLVAKINTDLKFSISTIPNPVPGDTSSSLENLPYIPGSSFSSDATNKVLGIKDQRAQDGKQYHVYPVIWLRTVPLNGNLNGAYHFEDISSGNIKLLKQLADQSWTDYVTTRNQVRTFNFNPAIYISNVSNIKKLMTKMSNMAQATIIGVWGLKSDFSTDQFLFTIQGMNNNWTLFSKQSVLHSDNTVPNLAYGNSSSRNFMYQQTVMEKTDTVFHEKELRTGSYYVSAIPQQSVWGETQESSLFLGVKRDSVTAWNNFIGFQGYIPEILIFNHQLSQKQILTYNTYLAIKYGLTLDTSYVSNRGDIIWDYPSNSGYNNRITGYGREDDLGLMQKVSTTSYEEYPYFSELYDAFDSADSYHSASKYRLLVMGLQPANPINDGRYVVFGDNGGPLKYDSISRSGYRMLTRRWKLQTNMLNESPDKVLSWNQTGQNLIFSRKYGSNVYRADLTKKASSGSSAIVTSVALKGKDGYFAWTVDIEYGPIIAKFGTNSPSLTSGQNDYGYRIDVDGQVHRINRGNVQSESYFTVEKGQRLEIEKNEKAIYLKVDGVRYKSTEFLIDTADINKSYYGAIIMGESSYDFKLRDFRHGGFVNTGHRIELSYDLKRASGFSNPSIGKIYLLVDTTGQSQFSGYNKEYPCDELDTARTKIIFNNVFWDSSPTGKYYFTFAYRDNVTLRSWESDNNEEETEETGSVDDIQVYNSGHGAPQLTVRIKTAELTPVDIQLFDLSGRRVAKEHLPASLDVTYTDFQMPAKGVYIVKIATQFKLYTHQVISK